jgi:hypothetical protein
MKYNEHLHAIRKNNSNSGYSNHILGSGHTIRYHIVDIKRPGKKRKHLNSLKKYNIYGINKDNLQINDTYNDTDNPILETLR